MDVDETSSESTNDESVSTGSPQSAGIPDVFVINSDDLIQSGSSASTVPPDNAIEPARSRHGRRKSAQPKRYPRMIEDETHFAIPRAPFARIIRELLAEHGEYRISELAIEALQESSEMIMVQLFEDAKACTDHASRRTTMLADLRLSIMFNGQHFYVERP